MKYSLKVFASPMFAYNVLLLFNFKWFLPFLCRDSGKFRLCHFALLQTQWFDDSIQRPTTLDLKNFKWQLLKIFKELKACSFCTSGQWRPYCLILILTLRISRYLRQSLAMFKPIKMWQISPRESYVAAARVISGGLHSDRHLFIWWPPHNYIAAAT